MHNENYKFLESLLAPYGPQLPIAQLIPEVNRLFHAAEAKDYDDRHPEIFEQLPLLWHEMVAVTRQVSVPNQRWRILDFGCGTGFEALQAVGLLPEGTIDTLACYDPSTEMLEICRKKVSPHFHGAVFTSTLEGLRGEAAGANLLLTNSLLHHLPSPIETIYEITDLLDDAAIWLAGHEPSNRFYKNPETEQAYRQFLAERARRKFFDHKGYTRRLKIALGAEMDPCRHTARRSVRAGLFKSRPPALVIDRLVDFNVAHSFAEASNGRGFDFQTMESELSSTWKRIWVRAYSFCGNVPEIRLPARWQRRARELARAYPNDGANFCSVWRRCSAALVVHQDYEKEDYTGARTAMTTEGLHGVLPAETY